jgi:hypothetical protein
MVDVEFEVKEGRKEGRRCLVSLSEENIGTLA